MNDYIEVRLTPEPCSETVTDILAAMLAEAGYESFVPDDEGMTAYVPAPQFSRRALDEIIGQFPLPDVRIAYKDTFVEGRDWNSEWEKNYFQPIVVGDRCVIHSSFHTDIPECEYDIVIDPKMAFGTGHHSTTSLIISRLLEMDLCGKHVIDMGTGTGILAILAAMKGATEVDAIEIDAFAHANAVENVALNGHSEINVILGDASALEALAPADIFIANINRNIITADLTAYARAMKPGAIAIFSGFYVKDISVIENVAGTLGLETVNYTERLDWASLMMKKQGL